MAGSFFKEDSAESGSFFAEEDKFVAQNSDRDKSVGFFDKTDTAQPTAFFDQEDAITDPQQESTTAEQIKEIPKSAIYGAIDSALGIFEGSERGFAQLGNKLSEYNQAEYNKIIASGGDPEGWRAQAFDGLSRFHKASADWWIGSGEGGGADYIANVRDALSDKFGPLTNGFVTDVARGVGGMATLPLDVSAAGVLSIPSQMFDEGYQQAVAEGKTEQEAADVATAYAFLGSPVEAIGDVMLKKFGGKATVKGVGAIMRQALRKVGLNFASEGSTEVVQDAILNKLNGKKAFTPESLRTFLVAGTVGSIVSVPVTVGDQRRINQSNKYFEQMGLTPDDAATATQMRLDGATPDEIITFADSKIRTLTDVVETALSVDTETRPLDEKQSARLETLSNKETLNENENAELQMLTMQLEESDQDVINNYLEKIEGSDAELNELIGRLKQETQETKDGDTERESEIGTEQGEITEQQQERTPETAEDRGTPEQGATEETVESLQKKIDARNEERKGVDPDNHKEFDKETRRLVIERDIIKYRNTIRSDKTSTSEKVHAVFQLNGLILEKYRKLLADARQNEQEFDRLMIERNEQLLEVYEAMENYASSSDFMKKNPDLLNKAKKKLKRLKREYGEDYSTEEVRQKGVEKEIIDEGRPTIGQTDVKKETDADALPKDDSGPKSYKGRSESQLRKEIDADGLSGEMELFLDRLNDASRNARLDNFGKKPLKDETGTIIGWFNQGKVYPEGFNGKSIAVIRKYLKGDKPLTANQLDLIERAYDLIEKDMGVTLKTVRSFKEIIERGDRPPQELIDESPSEWEIALSESGKTEEDLEDTSFDFGFNVIDEEVTEAKPTLDATELERAMSEDKAETVEPEAPITEPDDVVGVSKKWDMVESQLPFDKKVLKPARKAQTTTIKNAFDKGLHLDTDRIKQKVKKKQPLNDEDIGALLIRKTEIINEIESVRKKMLEAQKAGDEALWSDLNAELNNLLDLGGDLTVTIRKGATQTARALASMAMMMDRKTYDLVNVMQMADEVAGAQKTDKAKEQHAKKKEALKEVVEERDSVTKQLDDLSAFALDGTAVANEKLKAMKADQKRVDKVESEAIEFIDQLENLHRKIRVAKEKGTDPNADIKLALKRQDQIFRIIDKINNYKPTKEKIKKVEQPDSEGYLDMLNNLKSEFAEVKRKRDLEGRIEQLETDLKSGDIQKYAEKKTPDEKSREELLLIARQIALGKEIDRQLSDMKPKTLADKARYYVWDVFRNLKLSIDVGHLLRQGGVSVSNPKMWKDGDAQRFFAESIKALSEKNADMTDATIMSHKNYGDWKLADLAMIEEGMQLDAREEILDQGVINKIPYLGKAFKSSGRAQITGTNLIRLMMAESYMDSMGGRENVTLEQMKDIAKSVNILTGRGATIKDQRVSKFLNTVLTSPSFTASRFQAPFLLAHRGADGKMLWENKKLRNRIIQDNAWFVGSRMAIMAAVAAAVPDVEIGDDPDHWTYGRLIIPVEGGKSRVYDPWAGIMSAWRALYSIPKEGDSAKAVKKVFEGRKHPALSAMEELYTGKTFYGEEIDRRAAALRAVLPISVEGVREAVEEDTGVFDLLAAVSTDISGIGSTLVDTRDLQRSRAKTKKEK